MKCDRWWNDGRHDHVLYAELDASLDVLWLRLIAGDPTGQPWHEVLAAWPPELHPSASTFFGVRRA